MTGDDKDKDGETSAVWKGLSQGKAPEGLTYRTTYPTNPNGVDVMMQRIQSHVAEPIHKHPGDDMTVVVEGTLTLQFYVESSNGLVPDGDEIVYGAGDISYIKAGRIHTSKSDSCKLVYVSDGKYQTILVDDS